MANFHEDAWEKAKVLGATSHSEGINWDWATGFPSSEKAKEFNDWCEAHGYETRGVYPQTNSTADVRFRKDSDIVW